jgi:platelet-activating factor acetylhydrolase
MSVLTVACRWVLFKLGRVSGSTTHALVRRLLEGHFLFRRSLDKLLTVDLKVPASNNAPLRAPPAELSRWPLVIFSHGLAGTRTTYSQLCASLAAQGRVVIVLEHRDGTEPVFPRSPDGTHKTLYYVNPDEVVWPEDAEVTPQMARLGQGKESEEQFLRLRKDQLEYRREKCMRL